MKSRLYEGFVMHARLTPVRHAFTYPAYFLALDLDELPELNRRLKLFGFDRRRPWSIRTTDYLDREPGTIRERLVQHVRSSGVTAELGRIELVTCARFLGYVFNPVSFYYCHDLGGQTVCIVAEVNNTFGERHLYILRHLTRHADGFLRDEAGKTFHVSPFNNRAGDYQFAFSDLADTADMRVDLHRGGERIMDTQWFGTARPLTDAQLLKIAVRHPFATLLTVPRILKEAARLYWGRKLGFHSKPAPESPMTIRTVPPTLWQRIAMRLVLPYLEKLRKGCLRLTLPDGQTRIYGQPGQPPEIEFRVKDYEFFSRALRDSEIGFGESYMYGEWETNDLAGLIQLFIENRNVFHDDDIKTAWISNALNSVMHRRRRNTKTGSRRNIREHYDLSNEMFGLFLDPTMMYSCALYTKPGETLEQAQINKLHALIRKANIGPNDHVLEIGSGWGQFAIEAVRQTGCRVTTVTVSQQQLELATQRVQEAGLSDRITIELRDYRDITGQFDRIVSIEMLEAVGHEFLATYFEVCDRVLKPGGSIALQVISMPDNRYETYRRGVDWIRKHIFPGGHLPSLEAMKTAMSLNTKLAIQQVEDIAMHYPQTLREWRASFTGAEARVKELGFDDVFIRKWEYYFAYCEAAFATRAIQNLQIVMAKPAAAVS